MNFQIVSAILFSLASAVLGQYDYTIPEPICAKFKDINVAGTGEFVDTDGSGVLTPLTTGDMSVSFSLTGVSAAGSYPTQTHWREIYLGMNAVCVVKKNELTPAPENAPVCFYEAQMSFCRPWYIFPAELTPVKISKDKVTDIEALLSKEQIDPANSKSAVRGGDKAVIAEVAESKPENRQLQKNLFEKVETKQDDNELVDAVLVDEMLIDEDRDLFEPLKGKYVPYNYCSRKRKGGFTAHGTGSQNIKITGGTGGLFGAFGQIITPASGININSFDPSTGDIEFNFDMGLEICFYRREFGFWP